MVDKSVFLKTDFIDYYDHWFDREGTVFERLTRQGMNRKEMLDYLSSLGFKAPPYGTPSKILMQIDSRLLELEELSREKDDHSLEVVIYLDEFAHRGEGKILMPLYKAIEEYPKHLCSLFIPSPGAAISFRYLQVGDKNFWLKYTSKNDWRSNYGDVDITVLSQNKGYHHKIHLPLFATDFIVNTHEMFAIDFNTAPQIKHTGVENLLPAKEAAEAIKAVLRRND